ncbi:hypothetical protein GQR58_021930 [Nymphon striatum]|nr:hypothetical protein GQR58_021930 [Nymphon striatum]
MGPHSSKTANSDVQRAQASRVAGMTSRVAGMTSRAAGMTSRVAGMASRVAGMTSRVASMTSRVAGMTSRVASMTSHVASMISRVAGMTSRVAGMTPRVASMTSRVAVCNPPNLTGLITLEDFKNMDVCPLTGKSIIKSFSFNEDNLVFDFSMLFVLVVGYRLLAYTFLWMRARKRT